MPALSSRWAWNFFAAISGFATVRLAATVVPDTLLQSAFDAWALLEAPPAPAGSAATMPNQNKPGHALSERRRRGRAACAACPVLHLILSLLDPGRCGFSRRILRSPGAYKPPVEAGQRSVVQEPELEHVAPVEPLDPERGARGLDRGASRHEPAAPPGHSTPRSAAAAPIDAAISCSAAASQSVTFMLTWTSPACGSARPSARTPGSRRRARARAARSPAPPRRRRAQVDVERDQRPANADEHGARGRMQRRARGRGRARLSRAAARAPRSRRRGRTPARPSSVSRP